MIHTTPRPIHELGERLARLDEVRARLAEQTRRSGRWVGSLRRLTRGRVADSSVSIEGLSVPVEEAVALVGREETPALDAEAQQAVACYGRAMDHVAAMAEDSEFVWSTRVILDLHFDACYYDPHTDPGRWRPGPISITGRGGEVVYRAPAAEEVAGLMAEVVTWLDHGDTDAHPVVRAAMAHLHVVSVHPFRDGNGRVSRIVQSLVLAREGLLIPEFASIEEYLGEHTGAYYDALQAAHGSAYDPRLSAAGWVDFCVDAHMEIAQRRLAELDRAARRWATCERLVAERGWPDRLVIALEHALTGGLERARYASEAGIAPVTANLDFRRLVDGGLLRQEGGGRATRYLPTKALEERVEAGMGTTS